MDVKITFNDFTVTGANQLNNVTIKLLKGEKGDPGEPTDAQVQTSVNTWLAAHPEATTTVQDGAISYAKLDSTLKAKADDVDDLKSSIGQMKGFDATTKAALLALFQKCAFVDDDAQDYYDALEDALYPPADLDYITAVYTQSGTVYDTDTLDSLRSDLVVTAYYDDTTSATISNYTLSGTLAEGTSTVTVSYGGETATFTVTVEHYSLYRKLNRLYVDGSQYVVTSVEETTLYPAEYKLNLANINPTSNRGFHFFSSSNTYYPLLYYNQSYSGYRVLAKYRGNEISVDRTGQAEQDCVFGVTVSGTTVGTYYNGTQIKSGTSGSAGGATNYYTFFAYGGNTGNTAYRFAGYFYYLKLFDSNGNAVHSFIPVKRNTDSVIGILDEITGDFYTSSGSAFVEEV